MTDTKMSPMHDLLSRLDPAVAKRFSNAADTTTTYLPTASYGVNRALGGGIATKRLCTIHGNESAGKSALMMQSVGQWQKQGLSVAWVDTEKSWDKSWAEKLGIDNEQLILMQEVSISKIHNKVTPLLIAGVHVLVIDSISMAIPDAFLNSDGQMNDLENQKQMAAHAKAMTVLTNSLLYSNENTALVYLSQTTTKIEQGYQMQIPHGGEKVKFASSQILQLKSSNTEAKQITGELQFGNKIVTVPIGRTVQAICKKNKTAPAGRKAEYDIYFEGPNVGIDFAGEIVKDAIKYGVVSKGGAWFKYKENKWQGEANVTRAAKDSPELLQEWITAIDDAEAL